MLGLALAVLAGCSGCSGVEALTGGGVPAATLPVAPVEPVEPVEQDDPAVGTSTASRPTATSGAPSASTTGGLAPMTSEDLVALADRMTDVLRDGSEEEWAALFDLGEEGEEQQRAWYRAVRAVPMTVRELLPSVVVAADTPEGSVVEVVFAHQVEGADPVPARESYRLTVRRAPGEEPVITDVDGFGSADGFPQLWDLRELDVVVTQSLVVLAPDGREDEVAAVLPGLEAAVANVFLDFRTDAPQRLVVQLAGPDDVVAILDDRRWQHPPLGLAIFLPGVDLEGLEPGGSGVPAADEHVDRIVVDLDVLAADHAENGVTPPGGWSVMRHEGVHAVLDGDPSVSPPIWLWEGVAQWYGDRRDYVVDPWYADVVERIGVPEELPTSLDQYYFGSEEESEAAYAVSAMVFTYLDRTWGFGTARDVGVGLSAADTWYDDEDVDAVFLEETGLTFAQFEAAWRDWVAATYG
ncbi:hypothetical protein SAMN05421879_11162 [Ornithinimicrobium cerasi]|uniref:Peptidase MA superfamily protein n=1 Tax=Ornithinimicrobium cerasi TaxID=2248773 RepID=A0A285VT17_9MICO|nr:hypothetical protein SAMN05421879_11162 [Ornithinimicrobium cerasi]